MFYSAAAPFSTLVEPQTVTTYSIMSNSSTVFPCHQSLQILVIGNETGSRSVVRLYMQQLPAEGTWPTHVATTQLAYVSERPLRPTKAEINGSDFSVMMHFDCEDFAYWDDVTVVGFCFKFVSVDDVTGKVLERAEMCLPTHKQRG